MRTTRAVAMLVAFLAAAPAAFAQASDAEKFWAEMRKEALRDLEKGDPKEQISAAKSLGPEGASRSAPILAKLLSHPDTAIRLEAASALWTLAAKSAEAFASTKPALTAALDDPDGAVAMNAAGALAAMKVPAEQLAAARRRVLGQPGTPYVRFLAARGLIGLEPAAVLAPALTTYLEQVSAAAKRGGSRDNVQLARQALERLVDTKDRGAMAHLVDELRRTQHAQVALMRALHRYSPRPEGWTETLLAQAGSQDRDVASTAWDLLGEQQDPASLAKWPPPAARLLATERRDMALSALGRAAGKTATGLPELAAVARDASAEEDQRLRAIGILGNAADARTEKGSPEIARAALAQLLAVCEPILAGGPPGKAFEACTSPLGMAIPDQKERAKHYARWLAANPDPAAKIQHLQRLEGLWSDAFEATEVVKAELANPAPGVKQAAEKALDRIRPAWRESGARQAKQAAAPSVAKAAPAPAGKGPGADGAALYAAIRVGDVAAVKKLVTRANVLVPVRFGQVQNPPVPLTVAINYCGIPTVTPAKLAEIVAHLIAMGADPETKDHTGSNLFDRAKQACPPEVVAALGG